jgi:hypothetical protein
MRRDTECFSFFLFDVLGLLLDFFVGEDFTLWGARVVKSPTLELPDIHPKINVLGAAR